MGDPHAIPDSGPAPQVDRATAARRLKYALVLLVLLVWEASPYLLPQAGVRHTHGFAIFAVLLAAIFVTFPPQRQGQAEPSTFRLSPRFVIWVLPALAIASSVVLVAFQMDRNLCNPFRGCAWPHAFDLHAPNFILAAVSKVTVFYTLIITASFLALFVEVLARFRAGHTNGNAAILELLPSRYAKRLLTVAVLIAWYAAVLAFELPLSGSLPLAIAAGLLLAILLLALPGRGGRVARLVSELGTRFLLVVAPALALLTVVYAGIFGPDDRQMILFVHMEFGDAARPRPLPFLGTMLGYLLAMAVLAAFIASKFYLIIASTLASTEWITKLKNYWSRR